MLRKSSLKTLLVVLLIVALVFGYGPYVVGVASALGAGLRGLSPLVILVIGIVIGKVIL